MLKYLNRLSSRSPQPLSDDEGHVDNDDDGDGDYKDGEDVADGNHEDDEDVDDGDLGGGHLAQVSHQLAHHWTGGRRDAGQTCRR